MKNVKYFLPYLWSQRNFAEGSPRYIRRTKIEKKKDFIHEESVEFNNSQLEVISFANQMKSIISLKQKLHSLSKSPKRTLEHQMENNKSQMKEIIKKSHSMMQFNNDFKVSNKLAKRRLEDLQRRIRIKDKNNYLIKPGFKPKNSQKKFEKRIEKKKKSFKYSRSRRGNTIQQNIGFLLRLGTALDNGIRGKMEKVKVTTAAPISRERATLTLIEDNTMIMFGGYNYSTNENSYIFNFEDLSWQDLSYPPYFPKLAGHSAVSMDGILIVIGGLILIKAIGKMQTLHEGFITYSDDYGWGKVMIPNSMSKRSHHCSIVVGSDILINGGYNEKHERLNNWSCITLNQENMSFDDWCRMNLNNSHEFPKLSNHAMCVAVHKDFIIRCVGRLEYKKKSNTISERIEKNAKLSKSGIYLFGGLDENGDINAKLYFITLDGLNQEWSRIRGKGKPPPGLYDHSMNFIEKSNSIAIFGGKVHRSSIKQPRRKGIFSQLRKKKHNSVFQRNLYLFDIMLRLWQRVTISRGEDCILQNRASHCTTSQDNKIYVFGGINEEGLLDSNLYRIKVSSEETSASQITQLKDLG